MVIPIVEYKDTYPVIDLDRQGEQPQPDLEEFGGKGSGHSGHGGRPGQEGGSLPRGQTSPAVEKKPVAKLGKMTIVEVEPTTDVDALTFDFETPLQEVEDRDLVTQYQLGNEPMAKVIQMQKRSDYFLDELHSQLRQTYPSGKVVVYRGGKISGNETYLNCSLLKHHAESYASGFTGFNVGTLYTFEVPVDNFVGIGNAGEYELFFRTSSRVKVFVDDRSLTETSEFGGKGSGHTGHRGRKGKEGGSLPRGAAGSSRGKAPKWEPLGRVYDADYGEETDATVYRIEDGLDQFLAVQEKKDSINAMAAIRGPNLGTVLITDEQSHHQSMLNMLDDQDTLDNWVRYYYNFDMEELEVDIHFAGEDIGWEVRDPAAIRRAHQNIRDGTVVLRERGYTGRVETLDIFDDPKDFTQAMSRWMSLETWLALSHRPVFLTIEQFTELGGKGSGHIGHSGRPGKVGGSSKQKQIDALKKTLQPKPEPEPKKEEEYQPSWKTAIERVSKKLGFPVEDIYMETKEGYEFQVGDRDYKAAGNYNPSTGKITLFDVDDRPIEQTERTLAHEIQHHRWATFNKAYEEQFDEIRASIQSDDKTDWLINADGSLKTHASPKKYWAYAIHERYLGTEGFSKLKREDGVTSYSTAYWDVAHQQQTFEWYDRAIDETLAEIAKLNLETPLNQIKPTNVSRSTAKNLAPIWKDLYRSINSGTT